MIPIRLAFVFVFDLSDSNSSGICICLIPIFRPGLILVYFGPHKLTKVGHRSMFLKIR